MRLSKEQSRTRWRELRELVNEWDPIGLISMGCPEDEYECLLDLLMRQLEASHKPKLIAQDLFTHISNHFGLSPDKRKTLKFVEKASAWFSEKWLNGSV